MDCVKILLSFVIPIIMQHFISSFATINQHQPWLMPFLNIHQALTQELDNLSHTSLASWLNDYFNKHHITPKKHLDNTPLSFTTQNDLPHGVAYERFIDEHQKIPTRDNLHDWFGACIWSAFPQTKSLLNAKHVTHMSDDGTRNRLRDAITVFDENGAILVVCDDVGQHIGISLAKFDWQNCLVTPRHHWHNPNIPNIHDKAQVFIFGHALLEQLINPRKPLCSHTLIITMPHSFFSLSLTDKLSALDRQLCHTLDDLLIDGVTPRKFSPLPILGVPHFWQENHNPQFYQDTFVFRQGRRQTN